MIVTTIDNEEPMPRIKRTSAGSSGPKSTEMAGVSSCVVRAFHRYWALPAGEIEAGRMMFAGIEIPRLDANPARPENGVLVLTIDGEG